MKLSVILCVAVLAVTAYASPVNYASEDQGYQQPTAGYQEEEAAVNPAYQENSHGDYKDVNRDSYNSDGGGQDYSSTDYAQQNAEYPAKEDYQKSREGYVEGKDEYAPRKTNDERPQEYAKESYNAHDDANQVAATAPTHQKNQPQPYAPMNSPYHGFPYNYYPFRLYTGFYNHLPQGHFKCPSEGYFYRDAYSYFVCFHQAEGYSFRTFPCPQGSMNRDRASYKNAKEDRFCDVNVLVYGSPNGYF